VVILCSNLPPSGDSFALARADWDDQAVPEIDDLRREIDELDATIISAVRRRAEVSKEIGKARMASGGTRLVHNREMQVIERYSVLGPEGKDLAMLLLQLGRGRLGH
jgi:chorismate mutase